MDRWKDLPIVSATLVAINIFVFLICTFTGNLLYNMGRMDAWSVLISGEYFRVLWALFLHGDIGHIFNNMLILFFLGAMIEKEVGHIRYTLFYFLSGIGGNLLSLWYKVQTGDMSGSIGASGAVFGLDGVLLAMVLFSKRRMENVTIPRVLLMIAYSLYSGLTGQNVDNAAHIGGLVTGFLAGMIMCVFQKLKMVKNNR
ncbi:MAG: rhomboid family intramembrane serine protease [Acetatifactor sp.]|nr:rhomboid family intramembrane serine protease [Acetatifactor sp.]